MSDEKAPIDPPPYTDNPIPTSEKPNGAGGQQPRGPRPPFPLDLPALNMIRGKRVILASASPRRRQLLAQVRRMANIKKHQKNHSNLTPSPADRPHRPRNHPLNSPRRPIPLPPTLRIRPRNRHNQSPERLRRHYRHAQQRAGSRPRRRHRRFHAPGPDPGETAQRARAHRNTKNAARRQQRLA